MNKEKIKLIQMGESIRCIKYKAQPFCETQKILGNNIDEKNKAYRLFMEGKSLYQKMKILLNSVGKSNQNTLYEQIMTLFKMYPLLEENTGIILIGEKCIGKSALYSLVFNEILHIHNGMPTVPELRGNAAKNSDAALLQEKVVILEELKGAMTGEINGVLECLKNAMESKKFLLRNKDKTDTTTSFVLIGNHYGKFRSLKELNRERLLENFPECMQKEEALFDRIPYLLPHYTSLTGEIFYAEPDSLGIPIEILSEYFLSIRNETLNFDLEGYKLQGRENRIYFKTIQGIAKMVAIDKVESWFIEGILEFCKHFHSLLTSEKPYNPFNEKSAQFILELLGFNALEVNQCLFHEERILIQKKGENIFHKIALTGYGIEQNQVEYEWFQYLQEEKYKRHFVPIIDLLDAGKEMIQEVGNTYSSKAIYPSGNRPKTDEDFNRLLIENIQNQVEASYGKNKSLSIENTFRGIPKFYNRIAQSLIDEIFGVKAPVYKKNYFLRDSCIQFLNFSEFISNKAIYNSERNGKEEK